ncbi:MAG TPA: tRNA dihydrouridine synthase DusB [Myxococcales bacterium]|jgi:nifR3 family TIM-barrel protein
MQIGPYRLPHPTLLAPMAPASEMPFRRICLELGAGAAPTELVSAEGLARLQARSLRYLVHDPALERPFYVQLFGGDPERMAAAARVAQDQGAGIIDVNMGCPVPKVTKNGAGASLMADADRACAIVAKIREATGLPVTAKIRSGWDAKTLNAVPFAQVLEQAGVCAVAVHGRTRAQAYSGKADWSVIAAVKRAVKVPVVGNGDVKSRADAERVVRETGCDAVMIGRAALSNPWLFRELAGGPPPTSEERRTLVRRHFDEHLALFDDPGAGVRSFRKPLLYYAHGLRGASHFRVEAMRLESPAEIREAIDRYFATAELDPSAAHQEVELDAAVG